jgi:flavorubredoxin
MEPFVVKNNVYWVGKTDWELKKFHGDEYSTHQGTTYNSYLIKDDKTVLIDTVWQPFAKEFVQTLQRVIDLNKIDYIVANHGEIDHSGALVELIHCIPDVPVYCTRNAVKSLKGHYHKSWNFKEVKTGDRLSLGSKELVFIEAPMLHWPDSMMTYLTQDNILFSNDAFGQHMATESIYNDEVNQANLFRQCIKYYANILTPFSTFVTKKIEQIKSLNLPVDLICPSHGVIWRKDPFQIVSKYSEWAANYKEDQITIIYDTMWNGTRLMAENIANGIRDSNSAVTIKVYNAAHEDKNDIATEVFKSKGIIVGSSTINRGILSSMAAVFELIKGLSLKNKKAASFGTYGWSGECLKILNGSLSSAGFEIINEGLKLLWYPDEEGIKQCRTFGQNLEKTMN